MSMADSITNGVKKQTMLDTYIKTRDVYIANLGRLKDIEGLLSSLGNPGDVLAKVKKAELLCHTCVRRLESLIDSLQKDDVRHISSQIATLGSDINQFETLSNEINNDIQMIKAGISKMYA